MFSSINFLAGGGPLVLAPTPNVAYSLQVSLVNSMTLVESQYKSEQIGNITNSVSAGAVTGSDRHLERVLNIIDMNIIPINVHALMKAIPLANIYNYVYTFEEMACLLFGQSIQTVSRVNLQRDELVNCPPGLFKVNS